MNRFRASRAATAMRSKSFWLTLLAALSLVASPTSARAAITPEGEVSPSDPATWDYYSTDAYIGNAASGTLTVDGGSRISSHLGYIGYGSGATGVVNISGSNSLWKTYGVCVGCSGGGTLSLANGGCLLMQANSETSSSYIGYSPGSSGLVSVDGPGSTLTNEFDLYVGNSGSGTISITNGGSISSTLHSHRCNIYIGYGSGSKGVAAVDGAGSKWIGYGIFRVGWSGNGMLSITNGASVNAAETWVGVNAGSTGMIDFGENGGTLTTGALFASPSQLAGAGTVITQGLVSDIDLRFDLTHGLAQAIPFQQPGQNVMVNLNATGTADALGAGWKDHGSLSIQDGIVASSYQGYVGYGSGSTGVVTVSGSGSTWNVERGLLSVGHEGSGSLSITNGGSVTCTECYSYIGNYPNSKGIVTVDGAGSIWTTTYPMYVGNSGSGTLAITNGGSVSAGEIWVGKNTGSTGMINFGANGGTLTTGALLASPTQLAGTGTIIVHGLVSDIDLRFDSTHGLQQLIPLQQSGQNITVSLDVTGYAPILGTGWTSQGSLAILDGITVRSSEAYLGYGSGSTGVAAVSGSGSTWNVTNGYFGIGDSGSGTLLITNGGTVYFGNRGNQCAVGALSGAKGAVIVDGPGSTWNVGPSSFAFVGGEGSGTLSITNGGSASGPIYIGSGIGSTGVVTVDGAGSTWNSFSLLVGDAGSGTLCVTNGGSASGPGGTIGNGLGSTGMVRVDGAGSILTSSGLLNIGKSGRGTLSISGGGAVAATGVSVRNSTSLLGIDVGRGSLLTVTNGGTITNDGTIRILAGASVASGNTYSPISAGTWTGGGTYQALGGTWDSTNHQFTVSSAAMAASGSPVTIDLASQQRVLVSDGTPGWKVGESFLATTTSTTLTSTAAAISGGTLTTLSGSLRPGETVLSGWNLSASSAYASGTPGLSLVRRRAGTVPRRLAGLAGPTAAAMELVRVSRRPT